MKAPITLIPLMLMGTLLTAAHSAEALPSSGVPTTFCTIAPGANQWQGLGIDPIKSDQWEDADNWTQGVPNGDGSGTDDDVCIPAGGVPRIRAGEEEHLRTLDVAGGATVSVDQGGKLFLFGDQSADEDSVVRTNGALDVVGGTLGGIAKLHVKGRLGLTNDGPGAASTVLTRECTYFPSATNPYPGEDDCVPAATPTTGPTFLVEVDDSGLVDVQGGGVNIGDATTMIVRGLLRVRSGAYIAADHGTRVELRPHRTAAAGTGTLRFEGDGGYLEGKIQSDTGIAALSTLVNQGLIAKTGGTGRTLVSAAYSQPSPGKVSVSSGTLLLPTGPATPAYVDGGVTYGTGRCVVSQSQSCAVQTTPSFQQSADFKVPTTDPSGANVVVRKLTTASSSADLGKPFEVHATSLDVGTGFAVIRLRYDASVLRGKRWQQVNVLRRATGATTYRTVKACTSTGRPPTGEVACVDRRGLSTSSRNIANTSGNPDVLMVVRTRGTSRWVGR